MVHIQLFIKT